MLLKGSGNGGEGRREDRHGWKVQHDVLECVWLVRKRLNKKNEAVMEGYKWFGHNRKHLHKKAVRGFSGSVSK